MSRARRAACGMAACVLAAVLAVGAMLAASALAARSVPPAQVPAVATGAVPLALAVPSVPPPRPVVLAAYVVPASRTVVVRPGGTLSGIAAARGLSWRALWAANRGTVADPDVIVPGEVLTLPGRGHHVRGRPRGFPAGRNISPRAGSVTPRSSFEACVIARESSGRATAVNPGTQAGGLYQFLPGTWAETPQGASYPGGAQTAPAPVQQRAFAWEYARYGTSPWTPSDGCG